MTTTIVVCKRLQQELGKSYHVLDLGCLRNATFALN